MKNIHLHFAASLFAATIFFTSCNSNSSTGSNNSNTSDSSAVSKPAAATASQPQADTAFMAGAADAGLTEVELGKIAQKNAKNQQVKDFGSMMITDHTKAGDELKALAGAEGVNLPDSISSKHQKMVQNMKKEAGSRFDKDYIGMMVTDHEKVIDEFKKEAGSGKDSVISAFASRTLPTLQKHLEAAKAAQQALNTNP